MYSYIYSNVTNKQTKTNIMKTIKTVNKNLKTELETLNETFTGILKHEFNVGEEVYVRLGFNSIEVSLANTKDENRNNVFGSEINLYYQENWGTEKRKVEMNFGSTGSFNPKEEGNEGAVWRTISAGSFITNWGKLEILVSQFCEHYERLCETAQFERSLLETQEK